MKSFLKTSESTPPAAEFADATSVDTTATTSGNWSDAATWSNGVPGDGDNAEIAADVSVTVDGETNRVKTLVVDGTLSFATDKETHLKTETVVTREGSRLEIGTESTPIQPDAHAHITFVHHEDISEKDHDPDRISKGLIVMGDVEIHGAEKTNWDELATAPSAGDTAIRLSKAPSGWQVGDDITIPGQNPIPDSAEDEDRTIAAIDGSTVRFDSPLEYDHAPPENDLDRELYAYVLNRSRNVVFESEVKETDMTNERRVNRQGHVMVMTPTTSVNYARFDHVGRTNKRYFMTNSKWGSVPDGGWQVPSEPNPQARYGFHYHETGVGEDPHTATGLVVEHSPGWGVVNHHSHANVADSISYNVFGAGFVSEAGDERGSYTDCFALRSDGSRAFGSRQSLFSPEAIGPGTIQEFGHAGHGFWIHSPGVAVEDCIAAGHPNYAFAIWSEARYDRERWQPEDLHVNFRDTANYPVDLALEDGLMPDEGQYMDINFRKYTGDLVLLKLLLLKSFTRNRAFASGGGLLYFNQKAPPKGPKNEIRSFTAYNLARFRDINGNLVTAPPRPHHFGERGNTGVAMRFSSQVIFRDLQLANDGNGGHGIQRNRYAGRSEVHDSRIEGFHTGVQTDTMAHGGYDRTKNCSLDNEYDIVRPQMSPPFQRTVFEDLDLKGPKPNIKLTPDSRRRFKKDHFEYTLNGANLYYADQHPDHVPFPTEEDAPSPGGWKGADDSADLVGKTNRELYDKFDRCVYGSPAPETAIEAPGLENALIDPEIIVDTKGRSLPGDEQTLRAAGYEDLFSVEKYEWDLGDGTTATGYEVTHTYEEGGNYDIEVTVRLEEGTTKTITKTVELQPYREATNPGPVSSGVRFDVDGDPAGVHPKIDLGAVNNDPYFVDITYKGYVQVPEDAAYEFSLTADKKATLYVAGTEVTSAHTGSSSSRIGLEAGLHAIRVEYSETKAGEALKVTLDGPGMSGEIPADVLYHKDEDGELIGDTPWATFSTTYESKTTVSFDASESMAPKKDSIASYEWDFGDGTTATGTTVKHTFGEAGGYTVELTVTTEDGKAASETVTVREPRPADNPGDVTEGISYEYFETGGGDSLPNFDELEPVRTGTTETFGLGPDHRGDKFAFRFTGYISVPELGEYTFTTESDDGSALYIGSEQILKNGGTHPMRKRSGSAVLSRGLHKITVTYFENTGGEGLNVFWSGPNTDNEEVPSGVLHHADGGSLDVSASGETIASGETATLSLSVANATNVTVEQLWTDWQVSVDNRGGADNADNRVDQAGEAELTWNSAPGSTTAKLTISPPADTYVGGTYAVEVTAEDGESSMTDIAIIEIE